jgi:hypothetical protein
MRLSATLIVSAPTQGLQPVANTMANIANNAERAQKAVSKTGNAGLRRSGGGGGGGGGGSLGGDGDGDDPQTNRGKRGAAGNRGAAGRNFSGLAQASGESSGLVAAYATLAANIFALTAAFKALSDAAKFEQLKKGLEEVGARSGTTLSITARKMQELSGYALSTVETMKSVASATAAGFSSDEIERLTRVAKGASVALGRDMSDSMDRLTRGTIKLEPELLDELGIMTRIDEATRRYALQNNLAASSLTLTQKNQAFLNAVLAEGEKKFGDIADSVDVSMYDKLSASIRDLGTGAVAGLNKFLTPLIELLINVPALGLIPLMGVLSTAGGKLIPDFNKHLARMGTELARVGEKSKQAKATAAGFFGEISENANYTAADGAVADRYLKGSGVASTDFGLVNTKKMILRLTDEQEALEHMIAVTTDKTSDHYKEMLQDLKSIKAVNDDLKNSGVRIESAAAGFEKVGNSIAIDQARKRMQQDSAKQFQNDLFVAGGGLGVFKATSDAVGRDLGIAIGAGAEAARLETERLNNSVTGIGKNLNGIRGTLAGVTEGFRGMGGVISTAFQGLQAAMGWIFIIMGAIAALGALWTWLDETFFKNTKELKEARTNLEAVFKTAERTSVEIEKMKNIGEFGKAADAAANSMAELLANFQEFNRVRAAGDKPSKNKGSLADTLGLTDEYMIVGGIKELGVNLQSLGIAYPIKESEGFVSSIQDLLGSLDPGALAAFEKQLAKINASGLKDKELYKERADLAERYAKAGANSVNVFKDIGVAAKGANDEIIKLRVPDSFNTPYKKIADSVSSLESGFKLSAKALSDLGVEASVAQRGFSGELFNTPELAQELGLLKGNLSEVLDLQSSYSTESAKQQLILNDVNMKEDDKKAKLKISNDLLTSYKDRMFELLPPGTAMLLNLKNMNAVLATANLQLVKAKLSFADLQVASMKTKDSIARVATEIGMMQKNGTSEFGAEYAALKEIDAAQKSYEYALKTHELRMEVIKLEAAAAKAKFEYEKDGQRIVVAEKFGARALQYMDAGMSIGQSAEQNSRTDLGLSDELRELYVLYYKHFEKNVATAGILEAIANKSVQNAGLELTASEQQITLLREKSKLLFSGVNIDKENIAFSQKILALNKEAADLAKSQRQSEYNKLEFSLKNSAMANRTKFGPQEEYQLKIKAAQIAITNAEEDKKFLIKEIELKMQALALDNSIRLLELDNAVSEAKYQAKRNPSAEADGIVANAVKLRSDVAKNMKDAFFQTAGVQNSRLSQADTTVSVAKDAATAVLSPLQDFLIEFQTNINEMKQAYERLGLAGNLVGLFDRGVANTAQQMSKDPRTAGMSSTQILAAATATELMTAETQLLDKSMESLGNHTNTFLQDLVDGTISSKEAFKKMASAIIGDIGQMIARILILRGLSQLFGSATGGMATPGADVSQLAYPGQFAAGGVIPMAAGGITSRARQQGLGVIKQPTYLVGEAKYNEAVVPLPNGRAIPVQMHGNNTSSNNVQVNVNLSQNGEAKTDTKGPDMNNLGAAIASAVQKELLAQKAPGGILSRYGAA